MYKYLNYNNTSIRHTDTNTRVHSIHVHTHTDTNTLDWYIYTCPYIQIQQAQIHYKYKTLVEVGTQINREHLPKSLKNATNPRILETSA